MVLPAARSRAISWPMRIFDGQICILYPAALRYHLPRQMQRRKSASQRQNGGWGMYFAAKNIVRSVFATGRSARLPFLRHLQAIYAQREKESCAMKTQVKALVVGGGAVGTSIAYHLGKRGWDTMLIERD